MIDLPPNGVCLGSCDIFIIGQVSDNVSETVQD